MNKIYCCSISTMCRDVLSVSGTMWLSVESVSANAAIAGGRRGLCGVVSSPAAAIAAVVAVAVATTVAAVVATVGFGIVLEGGPRRDFGGVGDDDFAVLPLLVLTPALLAAATFFLLLAPAV